MDSVKQPSTAVSGSRLSGKQKDLMQILLFVAIAYSLMFIFGPLAYSQTAGADMKKQIFYHLAAFSPAIACVIVRYAFGEGFKDDILFPKFGGHKKAYLLSVALPLLFGLVACVLVTIVLGAGFSFKSEGGAADALLNNMLMSAQFYYAAFILVGEEFGWRAFLYDKLEKHCGLHASLIIGGILWGVWHLPPLVCSGLNFGTDAPGFPVTNVALMCVFCILAGAMMQLLRKMSDSVIAPLIAHAVIDTVCNTLISLFLNEELAEGKQFTIGLCLVAAIMIVGIPCWIILGRRKSIPPVD
jgi:membrane protease YdiL (CAAX protease family)